MISKRMQALCLGILVAVMPAVSQVRVDHYRDDGTRYVLWHQDVMYDDYFHAARFAIEASIGASGFVTYALQVTYDEGLLHIAQGDSLTLVLTRSDIVKRHYLTYNDYYVTCHYPLSNYDIQRITRNRVTKLSAQTQGFTFDRRLDKFQDRFRQQFTQVYRYLYKD